MMKKEPEKGLQRLMELSTMSHGSTPDSRKVPEIFFIV